MTLCIPTLLQFRGGQRIAQLTRGKEKKELQGWIDDYVVLTLCHSMTYGGLSAIVDDFFIRPAFRGTGLGKAAMAEVRSFCSSRGVRAIHVETGRDNAPALAVYRRAGFVETDLEHLTLGLADPTHAP